MMLVYGIALGSILILCEIIDLMEVVLILSSLRCILLFMKFHTEYLHWKVIFPRICYTALLLAEIVIIPNLKTITFPGFSGDNM